MSARELDSLPPELRELVASESGFPEPDATVRAAVRAKVMASIAATAAATTAAATASTAEAATTATKAGLGAKVLAKPVVLALVFAGGGVTGAALHATVRAPEIREVRVEVPVPAPAPIAEVPAAPAPVVPVNTPRAVRLTRPSAPAPVPISVPENVRDASLEDERLLLETARTALARGRVDGALAATEAHAQRFPRGQLAEEREAIAIQALVVADRLSDAQTRARAFHAAHPDSLLGPAVDAALRSGKR